MTRNSHEKLKEVFKSMASRAETIQPVPCSYEVVEVKISVSEVFQSYISALMQKIDMDPRGSRINEQVQLTEDEVHLFLQYLADQRAIRCQGGRINYQYLNDLWVPAFFATAISMIGNYDDQSTGLQFRLVADHRDYDPEEIDKIAQKFSKLRDVIAMVKGAAPRPVEGDPEVMTMACIGSHVQSMSKVSHPLMTYFVGFLNMKIVEESAFRQLYRIQYDNVSYLASVFRREGDALC